ncbi:MAG TPA: extracellular solute-binding protein, partial [Chloroflexota bacterium]|nr:extracellular solute-binding protein [Chloroflexota bacterium]
MTGNITMGAGMTRRRFAAGTAVLTGGALAAACTQGATSPGEQQAAGSVSKTPATVVYWCNVGQQDWEKIEMAAKEYAKKNPHHKIEATNYATSDTNEASYGAKLITAFAGGSAPDVIWTTTRRIIPFALAGGLQELSPYYSRSKIRLDQYYP